MSYSSGSSSSSSGQESEDGASRSSSRHRGSLCTKEQKRQLEAIRMSVRETRKSIERILEHDWFAQPWELTHQCGRPDSQVAQVTSRSENLYKAIVECIKTVLRDGPKRRIKIVLRDGTETEWDEIDVLDSLTVTFHDMEYGWFALERLALRLSKGKRPKRPVGKVCRRINDFCRECEQELAEMKFSPNYEAPPSYLVFFGTEAIMTESPRAMSRSPCRSLARSRPNEPSGSSIQKQKTELDRLANSVRQIGYRITQVNMRRWFPRPPVIVQRYPQVSGALKASQGEYSKIMKYIGDISKSGKEVSKETLDALDSITITFEDVADAWGTLARVIYRHVTCKPKRRSIEDATERILKYCDDCDEELNNMLFIDSADPTSSLKRGRSATRSASPMSICRSSSSVSMSGM